MRISGASLLVHSHLSGGLRSRKNRAVPGNRKFVSQFLCHFILLKETISSVLTTLLVVFVRRNTIIELTYRKEFVTYCCKVGYDDNRPT